jgi:hypothetical protein
MSEIAGLVVEVRRQWNDWKIARFQLSDIADLKWDNVSGGVRAPTPQPFVHGYVYCDASISGELAHSCRHGEGPHRIKICLTRKGNESVWPKILEIVGQRPRRTPIRAQQTRSQF